MKKYVRCATQVTEDKQQYIFDFITQGDTKLNSIKEQLIPNISFRTDRMVTSCDTVYLKLPEELKDYLEYDKPFKKRNQVALQDFARMLFRWSGASTPAINIFVGIGCSIHYINSLDMVIVPIDHDGYDRTGYWTKYLITAGNTNEFTIGYTEPDMFSSRLGNSNRVGYVKKNGSTILRENIPDGVHSKENAYIALGLNSTYDYTPVIDFLENHNCFQY